MKTVVSIKQPANHELLHFLQREMRLRKAGKMLTWLPRSDASREERMIQFFLWARSKFPRQACPLNYVSWVIDGGVKRVPETSKTVESLKGLLSNKRVQENLAKKNQRIFYVRGLGEDAGYRMNADDEDMALSVLTSDKRRVQSAMHRAAQTHNMIDETKLLSQEAREAYGDIGSMMGLLSQAGHISLPEMSTDNLKRLQSGIRKRQQRRSGA